MERIIRPALAIRAPTGYYNQPVYFDNPRPGIEKVTVAQLEELVHSRTGLPCKLAHLELTESGFCAIYCGYRAYRFSSF